MTPNILNRAMLADDSDQLPVVGDTRCHLGALLAAKPPADLTHDVDGMVRPQKGGMSVFCGDPLHMPPSVLPRELGGNCDRPLFQMDEGNMPSTLTVNRNGVKRRPPSTHANVEPRVPCHRDEYQKALHSTRPHWRRHQGAHSGK